MLTIRKEYREDAEAIRKVNERAFGQPDETNIVDKLRETCQGLLSLVAVIEDRLVGHIFFSPVTIEGDHGVRKGMGLAPMAVIPEYQHQGIGSELVRSGLAMLKDAACPFVIVLGYLEYYPHFGFEPASKYGIRSQWDGIPDDAFMILVLDKSAMYGISGVAKYQNEFNEAT